MSERDIKWALDLAIEMLLSAHHSEDFDRNFDSSLKYKQAAEIIRYGGKVVDMSKQFEFMCKSCGELYEHPVQYCTECISGSWSIERLTIPRTIRWTEREKIQIVTEKSEPTFKEVSDV